MVALTNTRRMTSHEGNRKGWKIGGQNKCKHSKENKESSFFSFFFFELVLVTFKNKDNPRMQMSKKRKWTRRRANKTEVQKVKKAEDTELPAIEWELDQRKKYSNYIQCPYNGLFEGSFICNILCM